MKGKFISQSNLYNQMTEIVFGSCVCIMQGRGKKIYHKKFHTVRFSMSMTLNIRALILFLCAHSRRLAFLR